MASLLPLTFSGLLTLVIVHLLVTMSDERAQLDRLRHEATTDSLTGLGNRRGLQADLPGAVAAATGDRPLAVIIFDLDGFKAYNDSYGHTAGDRMLARIAHRLQLALAGTGRAYRLGGDEFCALVDVGRRHPQRMADYLAASMAPHGLGLTVTASHGCATAPTDGVVPHDLMRRADRLMYARKRSRGPRAARHSVVPRNVARGKGPMPGRVDGNIFVT